MSAIPPPPGLTEPDFERIEAAVMETERGRWFLAEYARRARVQNAESVMAALARIEETLSWSEPGLAANAARRLLVQAEGIEERLQDLAWRLREQGADGAAAAVEAEIFALRALTAPPPAVPGIGVAASLENAGQQGDRPAEGFDAQGQLSQRLRSIGRIEHGATGAASSPPPAPLEARSSACEPAIDRRREAFAAIEALSPREKLVFFA